MKHTKEQIVGIVKKLLHDINRKYWEHEEFVVQYEDNTTIEYIDEKVQHCWMVVVPVDDDRFNNNDGNSIFIYIDDDSGEIKGYLDGSGGRPIPMRAIKDSSGKYSLEIVPN